MSTATADLEAGFNTLLTTNQGAGTFYAAVSGRIYQGMAPEEAALPLARWFVVTDGPDSHFSADHLDTEIQFDLWGEVRLGNYALTQTNDKLFTLLQKAAITLSNHTGGTVRCIERGIHSVDDGAYRITSRWQIRATTS
jgi:hypothetical protein